MTFPDTSLDVHAELDINGTWTDITTDLLYGPLSISRGHPDESVTVSASTLSGLTFANGTGTYSSNNPLSPYYPYLVRNTQCRISIPGQGTRLRLDYDRTSYATCPDAAPLRITGDIDIRIDLQPGYCFAALCNKAAGSQTAWLLQLEDDGTLLFFWWDSGAVLHSAQSTASIPLGRVAVKVTLAVATSTVTFATAASIGGTYTQLGAAISTGTATTVFGGTAPLTVGDNTSTPNGAVYGFQLRNGIGGTVVASPDFTAQTPGVTSFTDAQSNTFTLTGTASIDSRDYRGHFEIPEWPKRQDPSGETVTVPAAGGGLLRRQGQRNNPLNSPMYRAWTRVTKSVLAAYWPMEDGTDATRLGSASGGLPMYFGGGALPKLASNSDFACSAPLPVVNGAVFSGTVQYSGTWTDNQAAWLIEVPGGGDTNGAQIAALATAGTVRNLVLSYWSTGGGSLQMQGFDGGGNVLFDSTVTTGFNVTGKTLLMTVILQNTGGGNIGWAFQTLAPGSTGAISASGTISGSIGAATRLQLNPFGTLGLTGTVFGHAAVLAKEQSLFALDSYLNPQGLQTGALSAWAGEPAGIRLKRLCREEGIPFTSGGNLTTTPLMGIQTAQTLTQLAQECADADRGIWYEQRQATGWGYVPRSALYNQAAQVTVDYAQDHLSQWPSDPLEDDQVIVNDATVSQTAGGSSARQFAAPGQPVTGGRLSTLAPPAGAGTYDQAYTINLYNADDLDALAGWIIHTGTVDQPRYPGIMLDLANRNLTSLFWPVLNLDLGGRLVIDNPPAWLGPDPISQIAQQIVENLWSRQLDVTVCGVPELPYEVAQDGLGFHVDTDGSSLHANYTYGGATLQVDTASGFPLWITAAGDFPFDIACSGMRLTVTNITGSSSPQTFSVTPGVNGVQKNLTAGAAIALWNTPVIAL